MKTANSSLHWDHHPFQVFTLEDLQDAGSSFTNIPGCYKFILTHGQPENENTGDKGITINNPSLLFFSPKISFTWGWPTSAITGFCCIIREAFLSKIFRKNIHRLPMFTQGGQHEYQLAFEQYNLLSSIFSKLQEETSSSYLYKDDLIRNYISQIIHIALKNVIHK
jgi:hypothetical protein